MAMQSASKSASKSKAAAQQPVVQQEEEEESCGPIPVTKLEVIVFLPLLLCTVHVS